MAAYDYVWKFQIRDKVRVKSSGSVGTVLVINNNNEELERRYYVKFRERIFWIPEFQLEKI